MNKNSQVKKQCEEKKQSIQKKMFDEQNSEFKKHSLMNKNS